MHQWKIPQEFINELLARTNIIDLIGSKLSLKKNGNNYKSLCPFHNEKTPSFVVNDIKQFYHCFGCQAHGNAIDFLMNYEQLNFIETIEELSLLHGLSIPNKSINPVNNNVLFHMYYSHQILKKICNIYYDQLLQSNNTTSYQYLIQRGIKKKTIEEFSIGFSGNKSNNIAKYFSSNTKQYNILIKLGLIIKDSRGRTYDHFRNRIIFPIRDRNGRINGFGGRAIYPQSNPKYLNSSESFIFKKSKQIYGIYELIKKNLKPNRIIVVEGYIDVVMLTQFKINYVVAILGSTITTEQIKLIFRITDNIIYCYDGDKAGKIASWTSLKLSLPYLQDHKSIKFIFLPNNTDPDTIIQQEGTISFQNRINNAMNASEFLFLKLLHNADLSSIEKKSYFSSLIIPLINLIPGKIMRTYLHQKLGLQLGILNIEQLNSLFLQQHKKNLNIKIKHTPMRTIIGLLIQNPKLSKFVPKKITIIKFNIKGFDIFLDLFKTCISNPKYKTGQILELYRNSKIENILKKLTIWDHMIIKEKIKNVFLDSLTMIYNQKLEKQYYNLIMKEKNQGLNKNEKKELWSITVSLSQK
ncbi:DNA primase [Buchnera aphidicola (Eriosoma lanigerum)]|uniref:DNA primase n=1 Tax=Buchnera aphidicola TaxID=9 RepID=UPI003464027C